jgi:hypothetical protein
MLSNRTRSHGSSLDMLFANMSEDVQTTIVPAASPTNAFKEDPNLA